MVVDNIKENYEDFSKFNEYNYIYNKLITLLMVDGKFQTAKKIVDQSINNLNQHLNDSTESQLMLLTAIYNVSPTVEIKAKRIGSSIYQIPQGLTFKKRLSTGIKLLIKETRLRKEYKMVDRLSNELIDAFNMRGVSIKQRDDIHKQAELNKTFAHFNW